MIHQVQMAITSGLDGTALLLFGLGSTRKIPATQ